MLNYNALLVSLHYDFPNSAISFPQHMILNVSLVFVTKLAKCINNNVYSVHLHRDCKRNIEHYTYENFSEEFYEVYTYTNT